MGTIALVLPVGRSDAAIPEPTERHDPSVTIRVTERSIAAHWGDPCAAAAADRASDEAVFSRLPSLAGRSLVLHDRQSGATALSPDTLGLFPILVSLNGSTLRIAGRAAEMAAMLGREARLDADGVLELLAFGQLFQERSPLRDVRHLAAGQPVIIQPDGSMIAAAPADSVRPERFSMGRAIEALVSAVDRRFQTSDSVLLPLSGGLDSRLLLAAARASGHRPDAMCFGSPDSADRRIAQSLAESAGLSLATGPLTRDGFLAAADAIALAGTAEVPLNHGLVLIPKDLNDRCRGHLLMTGTGGEIYRAFYYDRGMPGMSALDLPPLSSRMMPQARRYAREVLDRTYQPFAAAFPSAAADLAARRDAAFNLSAERSADRSESAADFLDRLYAEMRLRRFVVAGQGLVDDIYHRSHPFLDPEVLAAWSGMPAGLRLGSRFHRQAIRRLAPALGSVDWDRTQRPLDRGLFWHERFPGLAARLGRAGAYAKQGAVLADYQSWLPDPEIGAVIDLLHAHGNLDMGRDRIEDALSALLSGPAMTHAKGVLGAVGRWLAQRQGTPA